MDYQEAMEKHKKDCRRCREKIYKHAIKKFSCLQEIDIKAYEELMSYRRIGTLEEVREAVEKQMECKHCGYKIHSNRVSKLNNCNDCGLKNTCVKRPEYGDYCRINCYDWRKQE